MHLQCTRAAPQALERGDASFKVDGRLLAVMVLVRRATKCMSRASRLTSDVAGDAGESLKVS